MKPHPLLALAVGLILALAGRTQGNNPFQSIGKKGSVLTLSNGKYDESFKKDSLEQVGSVVINRVSRKIERFLNEGTSYKSVSQNTDQSKFLSVDPLAVKFPYYSPYQFAGNTPIRASDLDGLEPNFT